MNRRLFLALITLPPTVAAQEFTRRVTYVDPVWYSLWVELGANINKQDELLRQIAESAMTDPPGHVRSLDRETWMKETQELASIEAKLLEKLQKTESHRR